MASSQYNQGRSSGSGSTQRGGGQRSVNENKHDFPLIEYHQPLIRWIKDKIDRDTILFAERAGEYLANNRMTNSQIRIAFGELKKIQINGFTNEHTNFLMLTPKLAYAAKRHDNKGIWMFYEFFKYSANQVDVTELEKGSRSFNNLLQVVEAVLAYHKSFGGKE